MDEAAFGDKENWLGSHYELYTEYPLTTTDASLVAAIRAVWTLPALDGPLKGPYAGPADALCPVPLPETLDTIESTNVYGILRLSDGKVVGCGMIVSRTDNVRWLSFWVPTGMLSRVYALDYTFEPATNPWMEIVDRALLDIAQVVHAATPFDIAKIGDEAGAVFPPGGPMVERLDKGGYLLSPTLFDRLRPRAHWVTLPSGLRWRPWSGFGTNRAPQS